VTRTVVTGGGEEVLMSAKKSARHGERYEILKAMLEDRRREIKEKLRSIRETHPAEVGDVKDAEEQMMADFVQEVDFALMQMKSRTLAKIDEAIRRVALGTYGICEDCAHEISEHRLKALPFAERCRDCQEGIETREEAEKEARTVEARLAREFPHAGR
jgi:DnaK suppressor protein